MPGRWEALQQSRFPNLQPPTQRPAQESVHQEGRRCGAVALVNCPECELVSLAGNEARLRMYIAVSALSQDFEHPEIPTTANARLKRVHGDGEVAIDLDRLVARSMWMTVESRTELSVTEGEEEQNLSVTRKLRFETKRE
jgi:hypothetical protein